MKQRVLIIGSSGMLGVDLCQELIRDYDVIGADVIASPVPERRSRDWYRAKQSYKCDITKKIEVSNTVAKVKPSTVIHAAAWTDVDGCELNPKKAYKINSEGTKNVALACKAMNATLIYLSTDFVFAGKRKNPYKETDKTGPLGIYADSKLKGEAEIKKILKKYFILRTSWLYGKHGKNFVDTILSKAKSEKVLKVVDDQVGSPTYTKDLARAIHELIDKIFVQRTAYSVQRNSTQYAVRSTQYGTYHVSNAGSISWYNYAKEILRLSGSRTKVMPISSKELDRPAKRPEMSVLDNSKFVKFTGYKMRNWQKALKEYV